MYKCPLPRLLIYKRCITFFIILCNFFISETSFSRKQWTRDFVSVSVSLVNDEYCIAIHFKFIDYEFGLFGEHAYLKWCNFDYSMEGLKYVSTLRCEVIDQVHKDSSWVKMTDKLLDNRCRFTLNNQIWPQNWYSIRFGVGNISNKGYLTVRWYLASYFKIKDIRVTGNWHVNGLNCSDEIDAVVYPLSYNEHLQIAPKTESKHINQFKNNSVMVSAEGDAIVIKGVEHGQNINVYNTSGQRIKSIVVKDNLVKIQLPANQLYIVNVGQTRYRVAL